MIEIRSHKDCPDDGKVYFPLRESSGEFCVNCKHYGMPDGYLIGMCMLRDQWSSWPEAQVCAKYERKES